MNERIKELSKQAEDLVDWGRLGDQASYDAWEQKFAELIIKECMDIAWKHTPDTEECEYSWLIHDKIKAHFGVTK